MKSRKYSIAALLAALLGVAFVTQIDLSTQVRGILPLASVPNLPASQITSGQLALARGGTNADLSATGGANQVVRQSSAGAALTVGQLAFSNLSGSASVAQIPNLPASIITSGQLALARGGTNADLSGTGGASQVLQQSSVGAAVTVAQLAFSDISGTASSGQIPNLDASKITTGQLALARGGTNADLSATGGSGFVLKQSSVGATITSAALASSDIPPATSSTFSGFWGGLGLGNLINTFTPPTSSTGFTANVAFVHIFYISEPITVSKATIFVSAVSAGTAASCGVYSTSGTKLIDSGLFTTTAGGTGVAAATNTFGSTLLPQGWYYQMFTSNSGLNGFEYFSGGAANILTILNKNGVRAGTATATVGGAQNASLGTVTASSAATLTNVAACLYE